MSVLDAIGRSLAESWWMLFDTFWALAFGFAISGAVQAFVPRSGMQRALGNHRPAAMARAGFFGMVSSSCSYAASAMAKSLFARGADFTAAMGFMIAATNLVVELGLVMWRLLGWQFAVAEFVGGALMIVLLAGILPRVLSAERLEGVRRRLGEPPGVGSPSVQPPRTMRGWGDAATYTVGDITMLRREMAIGFVVAGFLAELVPDWLWRTLFITGHGFASSLENVLLGPFLALISFVCSVGNVPLAAALWKGGISFGGTVSFVFADLVSLPLLLIYLKFYGRAVTLRLLATFWAVMSAAGLATEYLFKAAHLLPPNHPAVVAGTRPGLNATSVLDGTALLVLVAGYVLYRNRSRLGPGPSARDPVCGMQVPIAHPGAALATSGATVYFCSDRCRERFQGQQSVVPPGGKAHA